MAKQFLDLQGLQYFWGKIKERLNTKVDQIEGYGLSQNDFTNDYKSLLDGLEELDGIAVESEITADGNNPVKSSAIYAALDLKVNKVDFASFQETNTQALAGKVAVTDFNNFKEANTQALAGKVDNSTFEAHELANTQALAGKVAVADFEAYEQAQATALAGKVDNATFEAFQGTNNTALAGKVAVADFNTYKGEVNTALAGKVDNATLEAHEQAQTTALAGKVDNATFEAHEQAQTTALAGKVAVGDFNTYKGEVNTALAGKVDNSTLEAHEQAQTTALAGKVDNTAFASFQEENTAALAGKVDDTEFASFQEANTAALNNKVETSAVGAANGVAQLDANGMVPASQLPSYVDDVVEGTYETFPATGETGKIYVDTETNKTYRWSGSQYTVISETIALGETASTAFAGDKGKIAYDFAVAGDAKTVGGFTVGCAVPADAVFTDTTYEAIENSAIDTMMAD